jgi:hypothetical protein
VYYGDDQIFGLVYVADLLGRRRTRISASSWRRCTRMLPQGADA